MASDANRTVRDFGEQWSHYADNEGYYASVALLEDLLGPLASLEDLAGARVGDIGSGTGRIVRMLLAAGAEHVIAVEPSAGVEGLRRNTRDVAERVEIVHGPGEALPPGRDLDWVFSIGVLQFIPDPLPVLRAAREALRPGGRLVIWVYGKEGMGPYLAFVGPLRAITTRLPHAILSRLCDVLNVALDAYIALCRWLPLPLRDYARNTLARVSRDVRKLTIYDQLNPTYARYYTRDEARELVESAGFRDVELHHRRGYSWTVMGSKDGSESRVRSEGANDRG